MDDRISQLEKLVELRNRGDLTLDEFTTAKSAVLDGRDEGRNNPSKLSTDSNVSAAWERKFTFFRRYGNPWSEAARSALQEGAYLERWKIEFNVFAFVFGVFYFLYLGLWKRALTVFGLAAVLMTVAENLDFSERAQESIGLGAAVMFAFTANYAYFLKSVRGTDSWNPFDVFVSERQ